MTSAATPFDNPLLTGLIGRGRTPGRVSLDRFVVVSPTEGRRPVHARGRKLPP